MAKNTQQPELSMVDQVRIRREKLAQLQQEGQNPFAQTKFEFTSNSAEIKKNFEQMEGKEVSVSGRLMTKRGMGKVMFCDLQDAAGRIQIYLKIDEMDEATFERCRKLDIGDIVGVHGDVFRTQRGEISGARARGRPACQGSAAAAGQVPWPDESRDPLSPALCGPHREPRR